MEAAILARDLSIIIPTYNRAPILLKTLKGYSCQTDEDRILEILVADDGSSDETAEIVEAFSLQFQLPVRYLRLEHGGLAKTRNCAIREARGALLLMGDDDIIPAPHFVAEHLAWHEKYPDLRDAVMGRVVWSPDVRPTPFMQWIGEDLFGFAHLRSGLLEHPPCLFGIMSVKRNFLLENGMFDEDFRDYGFEDIELGHRLGKMGFRVFYNPGAIGYHYKTMSVRDTWKRAELVEAAHPLYLAKIGASQNVNPLSATAIRNEALRKIVRAILPVFSPMLRLFDTQIPLPWAVYKVFYWDYMVQQIRARQHASALSHY